MEISRLKQWDISSIQTSLCCGGTEDNTQSGLEESRCTLFIKELGFLTCYKSRS